MKLVKLAPAVFLATAAIAAIPNFAEAQQPGNVTGGATTATFQVVAKPAGAKFALTMIKGDIAVPPASSFVPAGELADFKCSNLVIIASSKATKPRPPSNEFWFFPPAWTRSDVASGSWASGKCSYAILVPPDEQFRLTAGPHGSGFGCHYVDINLTKTPNWQNVPKGTTKVDNVAVDRVLCGWIN